MNYKGRLLNEAAFFLFSAEPTNSRQFARAARPRKLSLLIEVTVRGSAVPTGSPCAKGRKNSPRRKDSYGYLMEELSFLRTFAAASTVLAAALVAANVNAQITVAGFMIFIVASIAWMADGWLETKTSLVIQNVILLLINAIGVWRWFPKAEKEARS